MKIALLFAFIIFVSASKCPNDTIYAVFNPGVCYYYGTRNMTYMNAEKECQKRYGNLIKTRNMVEDMYLGPNFTNDFWFGLRKMENNVWAWTDGTVLMYPNWRIGEPKDNMDTKCGAISFAGGKWSAQKCSTLKPFVCSLKARNYNFNN